MNIGFQFEPIKKEKITHTQLVNMLEHQGILIQFIQLYHLRKKRVLVE